MIATFRNCSKWISPIVLALSIAVGVNTNAIAWLGEEKLPNTSTAQLKKPTGPVHKGIEAWAKFKTIALTSLNAGTAYRELSSALGPFPIRLIPADNADLLSCRFET